MSDEKARKAEKRLDEALIQEKELMPAIDEREAKIAEQRNDKDMLPPHSRLVSMCITSLPQTNNYRGKPVTASDAIQDLTTDY